MLGQAGRQTFAADFVLVIESSAMSSFRAEYSRWMATSQFSRSKELWIGATILLALGMAACDSWRTWSARSISPDGRYIVSASTVRPGGWGTDSPPVTSVTLNYTEGSQSSVEIFLISSIQEGSDVPGSLNVTWEWVGSNHLIIRYDSRQTVEFQAIKCDGVDIDERPR